MPVAPAAFRDRYDIPAEIRILGPYAGNLSNSGERIRLRRPDSPNLVNGVFEVPYIDVDSVTYADRNPWPPEPDGEGPSLERISPLQYADDPLNWRASLQNGGTPGIVELPVAGGTYQAWLAEHQLEGADALPLADPDGDGVENLLEYAFGIAPGDHEFMEKVTVRDNVPVTSAARRFGRVRVTMD